MDRVVRLHAHRIEVSVFLNVVRSERVREENELRRVIYTRRVAKSAVAVEESDEELWHSTGIRRVSASSVLRPGNWCRLPEITKPLTSRWLSSSKALPVVERHLELRLRQIRIEIDDVVQSGVN